MSDICFEGLKILVMVAVLVLTRYVLPWVKSKADSEKLNLVAQWAYKAVLMAQQTMKATGGKREKSHRYAVFKRDSSGEEHRTFGRTD